jgi:integrase/recombinase XerD
VTFTTLIRSERLRRSVEASPLGPYMEGFVSTVAGIGYTPQSLYDVVLGATEFARHLVATGVTDVAALRERDVTAFVGTLPVYRCRERYRMPCVRGSRAGHHMLRYLRMLGVTVPEPVPMRAYGWVLDEWLTMLRDHRGLAPQSVDLYRRNVEPFLEELGADASPERLVALSPERARAYVQRQAPRLARVTRKNRVITLRSFLRFAFSRGYLARDVSDALDRVPCFTQDRLPRGPKWEDLAKVLMAVNRSAPQGRRDFAILLLLMTYGVRRGQLVELRVDDVHWSQSTITFPVAKRGRRVEMPLTSSAGDALVHYLRESRPPTSERRIFLSTAPPFRALAAGSVYNIVSAAFRAADIESPHRGSHAIRHAWATRAMAQGQSLKTIADLLGHRSLESTRIYAKVDVTQLRAVSLAWPEVQS